jgi:chitin disaccharide deacetylase
MSPDKHSRPHHVIRHIRLCADDYGIAPGVNAAILDLVGRRRINATSAMVVAPSFSANAAKILLGAAAGHAAIGLHLTLTAPFKPLSHGFAPLRHGAFLSLAAMMRRAHLRALRSEWLTIEIMRQVEAFQSAFGRAPDFIDGHQHVHLFPQIGEALLRVVKDAAPNAWVRQCGRTLPAHRRLVDRKALLLDALSRRFRKLAARHGVRTNPAFAGAYAFRADADYAKLFAKFLDHLPDGGVIMCHPGEADAELRRLDSLTDLRDREYTFFLGADFPRLLEERGVALS